MNHWFFIYRKGKKVVILQSPQVNLYFPFNNYIPQL